VKKDCEARGLTVVEADVVFTRRYRPADGPGLCPVFIDVSGVCPLYVRDMSDVCPTYVRRTVKVGRNAGPSTGRSGRRVLRTEGGAIITRDVMTYIVMI